MTDKRAIRAEAARLEAAFAATGATPVDVDVLQPAGHLLDLYGEDIRARAYVTHDPVRGECMMRPDFTAPIVLRHLSASERDARYTYSGEVFRQQETGSRRPSEFVQVGLEVFGKAGPEADAEIFATFARLLGDQGLRAITGDIGLLIAAVDGLNTTPSRKAALRRHLWRPRRFKSLLDKFGAPAPRRTPVLADAPEIGLRTRAEIEARLALRDADAAADPINKAEIDAIEAMMDVRETAPNVLAHLRSIAVDLPAMGPAIDRLEARFDAMAAAGVAVDHLEFEASYGRTTLEYYDGFVFGFLRQDRPDLPPVASGGRYDALTRALGNEDAPAAVGGVIRPALLPEIGR